MRALCRFLIGTYVALALQWGCTVDSMPQELCMDGASSTSLQPLAYSHFAQRGVLFQLLLLASLVRSDRVCGFNYIGVLRLFGKKTDFGSGIMATAIMYRF